MADPSAGSLSSVGGLLLGNRKGALSPQNILAENALGAAASLSVGVAVVRWLLSSSRSPALTDSDEAEVVVVRGGTLDAMMSSIRRFLRRLLLNPDELAHYESINPSTEVHVVDGALITHQGSCHCQSLRFEIKAPRTLIAKEGPGKINYRHTEIKASNLRVTRGTKHLRTYYVKWKDDRGAHTFCDRCGCHILHAPRQDSQRLLININCIDEGIRKIKVVDTKSSISNGSPLDSQWDDQLSTISEGSHDFNFSYKPAFRMESSISGDASIASDWHLYDDFDQSDPSDAQKSYMSPRTLTTTDSFTANATETRSLPSLRIPSGPYDAPSVMTDDTFSAANSDFVGGVTSPSQSLAQMKHYMRKHHSAPLKTTNKQGSPNSELSESKERRSNKHMAANAGQVVASLLSFS